MTDPKIQKAVKKAAEKLKEAQDRRVRKTVSLSLDAANYDKFCKLVDRRQVSSTIDIMIAALIEEIERGANS